MRNKTDFWILLVTGLFFGLFLINILLGKAGLQFDFDPILKLGDVGEFLMLLAAVVCFVVEVLRREAEEFDTKMKYADKAEEESK